MKCDGKRVLKDKLSFFHNDRQPFSEEQFLTLCRAGAIPKSGPFTQVLYRR